MRDLDGITPAPKQRAAEDQRIAAREPRWAAYRRIVALAGYEPF
jgi:hypothetical protein